eukprot:TRINITY_DN5090_c3_g1_i1.p1 TRINITY_DN5090_c3_g1~~TRINITY_DN5090_c3_g1_i1.p1  ORF type:complete len:246 (-),score=17.28 TRINITY_DN5090_c3_g1_i1:272-946(-)
MASSDTSSNPREVSEIFRRTRKCRFYGMGKCTRGSACNFAHATEELRPRLNLTCTKMCPSLVKTGSCTVGGCTYAHRVEDRRRRTKNHRQGTYEKSTGYLNPARPSLCSLLFGDASSEPLVDNSTWEAGHGVAKVEGNRHDFMINTQKADSSDDVALSGRVKDGVVLERFLLNGFRHYGFLVSVKNTFIDVDYAHVSSPAGLRRTSSAPGSISSRADNHGSISI